MSSRIVVGGVTVTRDGALEDLIRRSVEAASGGSSRVLEDAAQRVAAGARAAWYSPGTGVSRRTGRSGDVEVVTTVSEAEVRVSVGSVDLQKAKYVHRPGKLSRVKVEVSVADYWKTPKKMRANFKPLPSGPGRAADEGTGPYVWRANPNASDGRFLVTELVRKPAAVALQEAIPALTAAFASKVGS